NAVQLLCARTRDG
nr:Chain B, H-Box Motif of pUL145 [Human betaherpesvirus 5]